MYEEHLDLLLQLVQRIGDQAGNIFTLNFMNTGCPKKMSHSVLKLKSVVEVDFTFPHVFRNQNFEPVPSEHFKHTHSESYLIFVTGKKCGEICPYNRLSGGEILHMKDCHVKKILQDGHYH